MKILILQLARLGDIYLTWPALRALKRTRPDAEIHVLCRPRFRGALEGLEQVDVIHSLPSREMLAPLLEEGIHLEQSLDVTDEFIQGLKNEGYQQIFNLSYSPLSSYLTAELTNETTQVFGYTRFADGFLAIPDDTSAYFSAQVGVGRANRIHLSDLFAMTLDLDLVEADWQAPSFISKNGSIKKKIAIHMGASQVKKMYPAAHWKKLIGSLLAQNSHDVVLIGSYDETQLSDFIMKAFAGNPRLTSQVGEVDLKESFQIIADSELLIGADSAPIHMASLVQTPTLNISSTAVNYWETGPRAKGSVVVVGSAEANVDPDEICDLAISMIAGTANLELITSAQDKATVVSGVPSYSLSEVPFSWELTKAIYIGQLFPEVTDATVVEGMNQLFEANDLILKQIEAMKRKGHDESCLNIMASGEEVIEAISQIVPDLQVLVRWYQTEKLRLGPDCFEEVLKKTEAIHRKLEQILLLYLMDETEQSTISSSPTQEGNCINETDSF